MSRIQLKKLTKHLIMGMIAVVIFDSAVAEARFRGGGGGVAVRGGYGGARVTARTTVRPARDVTVSRTTVSRYHTGYRAGYYGGRDYGASYLPGTAAGTARRVARRTARRVAYRTAYGTSYYYGTAVYTMPSPQCYTTYWEGMMAYNCNGVMYVYSDGAYYPIEQI